jgi:DNA modification methylase
MKPYYQDDAVTLYCGDCRDVIASLADECLSSVVTDPPYGLAFMGKRWDYDVPAVEVWQECLRVLKPGGHLLAFAGTRTQHRMAVRIEDAGFEIRDMIAWVYGSGFPKSLDVSKAIDKMDASEEQERRRLRFTAWVRSTGITSRQIDEATCTNMGGHYTTAASQPAIMTREHLEQCRHLLGDVPQWVEREADIRSVESRNFAAREVLGVQKGAMAGWSMDGGTKFVDRNITAPATPEAQHWAGWGTALKPALEPITVARKPLADTVAANVLEHGTGALNVEGCRVGGRWPANLIHDGSEKACEPLKDAARFFYCAKASDREILAAEELPLFGESFDAVKNNHPTVKPVALMRWLIRLATPPSGVLLDPFAGSGTTGVAAKLEGRKATLIELDERYCEIAAKRLEQQVFEFGD